MKWHLTLALATIVAATVAAQPPREPVDGKLVVPITLSPQAAPRPVSDYYLTPQYKEQQPGDQLSGFMKCFMEQQRFFSTEEDQKRQKFLDMPLAELPEDVREQAGVSGGILYPGKYRGMMANLDLAARYTRTEWNEYFQFRSDGINWLLPEVGYMRRLASVAKLRLRGEVRAREFDRAIQTMKTLTGLAGMFKSHPTLIGNLVGIAIQSVAWDGAEELIAQPGCPNLFWSFIDLPNPPFDITSGIQGERILFDSALGFLLTTNRPLSVTEVEKVLDFITELEKGQNIGGEATTGERSLRIRLAKMASDPKRVEEARRRLVLIGKMQPNAVKVFGPTQVTLADDVLSYNILRDEFFKYRSLPLKPWQDGIAAMERQLKAQAEQLILAPVALLSYSKVKYAAIRNAQRVALLAVLEGLRLHAAGNGGLLPTSLDAVKLPLPMDPATLRPFEYAVKEGVATLTGAKIGANPQRIYEVRLRK